MIVTVTETPSHCRWCGCSERDPCLGGCGWANAAQTLCTACVTLDRMAKSVAGRASLAAIYAEWEDTNGPPRRG
jgi:hypothetical protein